MDVINNYALNVITKRIAMYGKDIEFKTVKLNDYNEPVQGGFEEKTVTLKCIYHLTDSRYSDFNNSDGGKNPGYYQQMLLAKFDDSVKIGNHCFVNGKEYVVTDICNYNLSNKVMDISICEVQEI